MTRKQIVALGWIWCKYGNGGSCYTLANHLFIQKLIEEGTESAQRIKHRLSFECKRSVDKILANDYSEFDKDRRRVLDVIGE